MQCQTIQWGNAMRGNTFGKLLSMTTFGESHGPGIGVVLDGIPSGIDFSFAGLCEWIARRSPGRVLGTSDRKEKDIPQILSGIFEDKTLGTPIAVYVPNTDVDSHLYSPDTFRRGHADKTTLLKYGIRDYRGGGRSSGRETLARVIGGYFASLVIPQTQVSVWTRRIGPFEWNGEGEIPSEVGPYGWPDASKFEEIGRFLQELKEKGDSIGGVVAIDVKNCPVGLGEPAFDKLKSDLAKALMSIGGAVAFSYGLGQNFANLQGSEIVRDSANFSGIEGGISNGEKIHLEVVFRAPSTFGELAKQGRHDPCIIPRVLIVAQAMTTFVLADHFLRQKAYPKP